MVPKDSLQSMAVPGSNTGKYTQPYSHSSPRKKLFSPSELKLPTTDTVLFYGHFSVLLPELFWSLLKTFTATVPREEQLVKPKEQLVKPRRPRQCQGKAAAKGRIWPRGSRDRVRARADLQPPRLGTGRCASSSDGVRGGDFPAGVARGQAAAAEDAAGDISGAVRRCDSAQHRAGSLRHGGRKLCAHLKGTRVQQGKPYTVMLCEIMGPPSSPTTERALARFNYRLGGSCAFPLPSFSSVFF